MSIWDGDQDLLKIPMKTARGKVFWKGLDKRDDYRLQKNIVFENCRILDGGGKRALCGQSCENWQVGVRLGILCRGDVIGVHRIGGAYDHYGIYENDDCVYEYAACNGDFGKTDIHTTTLKKFIGDSGNLFILVFPDCHGTPGKLTISVGA